MTACSTGLGGMSLSIAVEELARLGANTFLHVGIAEPLHDTALATELIIPKGAVRFDGTSHDYVRPEFPALAHFEIVMAAIAAAERQKLSYRVEIVASMASSGWSSSGELSQIMKERTAPIRQALQQVDVIGGSGQEATLFIQSALYGFRAGAILQSAGDDEAILASLEAMRILAEWDKAKIAQNLPHLVPPVV